MNILKLSSLLTASLLLFNGCTPSSLNPPKQTEIDKSLPIIALTQNGVMTDMASVAFEWSTIRDPRVEGIYVYRNDPRSQNPQSLNFIKTIENRFTTHYVDSGVEPESTYKYAFKVFSKDGKQGEFSEVYSVKTKPLLDSVSWIHSLKDMPRSAKILWRPHSNQRVEKYIIERKTLENPEWKQVATVNDRLKAEYLDTNLDDNHIYFYRIKVKTYDGIISKPSDEVKVITKPLPAGVGGLQASQGLPKEIRLAWNKTTQESFFKYTLYRSEELDGDYQLVAKLYNNVFIDRIDEDGKRYFYKVMVMDKDGLESENNTKGVMGSTLQKPKAPKLTTAILSGSAVQLRWESKDQRIVKYIILKETHENWIERKRDEFRNIRQTNYLDRTVMPNTTYTYRVYGLDSNDIISEASNPAEISTPENMEPAYNSFPSSHSVQPAQQQSTPKGGEVLLPTDDLNMNGL